MNNKVQQHKSSIGDQQANIMALVCYLAGSLLAFIPGIRYIAWLAPLVIFFLEKESGYVRFHAMQAFVLNAIGMILSLLVSLLLGGIFATAAFYYYGAASLVGMLATVISLIILVFAVIAMIKAYKYDEYHIPIVGKIADGVIAKAKQQPDSSKDDL